MFSSGRLPGDMMMMMNRVSLLSSFLANVTVKTLFYLLLLLQYKPDVCAAEDTSEERNEEEEEKVSLEPEGCDDYHKPLNEGILGQTPQFPWLGILKVHFHDYKNFRVAATGVILIKQKYGLVNSNEVSNIDEETLLKDSSVMFIVEQNVAWYCNVLGFTTHPQFEILTRNTISILELESKNGTFLPKPICWPHVNLNASNELYYVGYTDENAYLEKVIHKLQYVPLDACKEFYWRLDQNVNKKDAEEPDWVKNTQDMYTPVYYQCGYAVRMNETCKWENGMAVATNATGTWILVGMTVAGPGCSAPNRFLDIFVMLNWIRMQENVELDRLEDDRYFGHQRGYGYLTTRKTLDFGDEK